MRIRRPATGLPERLRLGRWLHRRLSPPPAAPWLATGFFLAAMAALGQISGLKLLLFPELGALASVVFSDPASPWARSPRLLVLTPLFAAVAGILVSRHLPYGPVAVSLALAAGLLVLRGLRSPVAPALSAGYLPVALGIRSWTYPLAILIAIGALVLLMGLRTRWWPRAGDETECRQPARRRQASAAIVLGLEASPADAADPGRAGAPIGTGETVPPFRFPLARGWLAPLVVFLAGALLLTRLLDSHLVLYPPLLVMAWETLARGDHGPWRGRPAALLLANGIAAAVGLVLARTLGPVPLAVFLAAVLTAALLDRLRLRCPPAFAVALLPLVLPQPPLALPLLVLAGGAWLVLVDQALPSRWR